MWQMFTDLEKKKQGPAAYLKMTGRTRELGDDDGLNKLIKKLDSILLKDESARACLLFKVFHHFKRSSG